MTETSNRTPVCKGATERNARIVALARESFHRDGEIEIDDGAQVSEGGGNGAYVSAWVWIDLAGTDLDKESGR